MKKKIKIYWIRFLIQAAEILGWTIVGYKLANQISGDFGVISLNFIMLLFATITSGLLSKSNINFDMNILNWAIKLRIMSFVFFICAWRFTELEYIILGGICSGGYVGIFWGTFYKIQNYYHIDFKDWNAFDKFSAIFLVISAASIVEWRGELVVLGCSLFFLLFSLMIISRNDILDSEEEIQDYDIRTMNQFTMMGALKYPAVLAFLEGFLNNAITLSRILVILGGTITIYGLPNILSLGLIIAISTGSGAFVPVFFRKIISEKYLVNLGIFISLISAIMLLFESLWIFGMITITSGSSILFPIFKSEVESGFKKLGLGNRCWREYSRNQGRLFNSIVLGIMWIISPKIYSTSIIIIITAIFIALVWIKRPVWIEDEGGI